MNYNLDFKENRKSHKYWNYYYYYERPVGIEYRNAYMYNVHTY